MRRFWLFRPSVVVGACLLCWASGRAESRGLLELTGKMVASAAGGVPPAYVFYDPCQNLDRARAGNCRLLEKKTLGKDGPMLRGIAQHPPSTDVGDATCKIPLLALENGKKAALRFGTCFSQATADGVRLSALVGGPEIFPPRVCYKELWSRKQRDLAPADYQVDLTEWVGKMISLALRMDAMGDDVYDGTFWVHPRVETLGGKPSSQQIQRS